MSKDFFKLYSGEWLLGTAGMPSNVKGAYIDLLCYQHIEKGLPTNDVALAKLLRLSQVEFDEVWFTLRHKFELRNGKLFNKKLEDVLNQELNLPIGDTIEDWTKQVLDGQDYLFLIDFNNRFPAQTPSKDLILAHESKALKTTGIKYSNQQHFRKSLLSYLTTAENGKATNSFKGNNRTNYTKGIAGTDYTEGF